MTGKQLFVRKEPASGLAVSPDGATLAWALEAAGYTNVKGHSCEHPTDKTVIENLLLYYDEIKDRYQSLGIMTPDEVDEQKRQLRALPTGKLPAVWGIHRATAVA